MPHASCLRPMPHAAPPPTPTLYPSSHLPLSRLPASRYAAPARRLNNSNRRSRAFLGKTKPKVGPWTTWWSVHDNRFCARVSFTEWRTARRVHGARGHRRAEAQRRGDLQRCDSGVSAHGRWNEHLGTARRISFRLSHVEG